MSLGEDFLAKSYGKSWHISRNYWPDVGRALDWGDINNVLQNHWHNPDIVRLVVKGTPVSVESYIGRREWRGKLMLDGFYSALQDGASLVVEDAASWHMPLLRIALEFEKELSEPVETQLFINGPVTAGFGAHWDPYDAFVVQLLGRRRWRICPPTRQAPLLVDKESPTPPDPGKFEVVDVSPGDVVYLPRGWWHDAGGATAPSVHLTVVVPKRTGVTFLAWVMDELCADEVARIDIPRFGSEQALQAYADGLRAAVIERITPESIRQYLAEHDAAGDAKAVISLPGGLGEDGAHPAMTRFGAEDMLINLVPRAVMRWSDDAVFVMADSKQLEFDQGAGGALTAIFERIWRPIRELVAESGLPAGQFMDLVGALQSHGLVAVVQSQAVIDRAEEPMEQVGDGRERAPGK
jgi:ribosomal protein L16 Arg81 hydroxylase